MKVYNVEISEKSSLKSNIETDSKLKFTCKVEDQESALLVCDAYHLLTKRFDNLYLLKKEDKDFLSKIVVKLVKDNISLLTESAMDKSSDCMTYNVILSDIFKQYGLINEDDSGRCRSHSLDHLLEAATLASLQDGGSLNANGLTCDASETNEKKASKINENNTNSNTKNGLSVLDDEYKMNVDDTGLRSDSAMSYLDLLTSVADQASKMNDNSNPQIVSKSSLISPKQSKYSETTPLPSYQKENSKPTSVVKCKGILKKIGKDFSNTFSSTKSNRPRGI
jgi:hypothetical protein